MPDENGLLLARDASLLLLIDPQTRLMPAIQHGDALAARITRLIDAARLLGVPVLATEHCPQAIGPLLACIRDRLAPEEIIEKRHFSAWSEPAFQQALSRRERRQIVLAGVEAHVCVAQTALALTQANHQVFCITDAIGSRHEQDRQAALGRFAQAGLIPVTMEAVLFEWLESADHPAFKPVLEIIKA